MSKAIEKGKKSNMRFGSKGETFITLEIINQENNLLDKVEFLVDTGFNGYLQLQESLVMKLGIKIAEKSKTRGFDNIEKEVGVVKTKIRLLDEEVWNFPIQVVKQGPFLIGTRLLKDWGKMIIIDYRNKIFTITGEKKVQKKVHKAVEKYHQ
jgi:clan AA aspartic protease